tara:strand:+ start:15789 stop:16508 length:720 start_codon:yes stop_codon:yes gene_type:complete
MSNKINISIDDICPHPASSMAVVDRCYEILEKIPEVKFTLFVPMAYYRTMPAPPVSMCDQPLRIDLFPDFCQKIRDLPKDSFEICYHGVLHGIPGETNNDEFKSLSYQETLKKISEMAWITKMAKLEDIFKPIFRPPAYRMSPEAIRAARDAGFQILCLSPEKMYKDVYQGEEEKRDDVVYSTCGPPIYPLKIEEKTEIVYHACEWDRNFLSKEKSQELVNFLLSAKKELKYCFMEGMI